MNIDELWMHRALRLAALGLGKAQPNPLVGAVIVHNGHIIGEGFHPQYGKSHAEVYAINAVEDQKLLKESTLYANLEPCAHYGKTPPCVSLIIEKRIPKVVVGMKDPNEKVDGRGILMLREANIEVIENVLYDECVSLNKRFITFHTKKRPYIFLKWAQTKNGFMDVSTEKNNNNIFFNDYWITNEALRVWVHKLRNEEQAILIGYNTFMNDKPQLTNRFYGSNQPKRFVLCDANRPAKINNAFSILHGNIETVLSSLYQQNIQSVIVEGGKKTLQKFIETDFWDEAFVLVGNVEWKSGVIAPKIPYRCENRINIDGETILYYKNFH